MKFFITKIILKIIKRYIRIYCNVCNTLVRIEFYYKQGHIQIWCINAWNCNNLNCFTHELLGDASYFKTDNWMWEK